MVAEVAPLRRCAQQVQHPRLRRPRLGQSPQRRQAARQQPVPLQIVGPPLQDRLQPRDERRALRVRRRWRDQPLRRGHRLRLHLPRPEHPVDPAAGQPERERLVRVARRPDRTIEPECRQPDRDEQHHGEQRRQSPRRRRGSGLSRLRIGRGDQPPRDLRAGRLGLGRAQPPLGTVGFDLAQLVPIDLHVEASAPLPAGCAPQHRRKDQPETAQNQHARDCKKSRHSAPCRDPRGPYPPAPPGTTPAAKS
jgi:hypothetical protein